MILPDDICKLVVDAVCHAQQAYLDWQLANVTPWGGFPVGQQRIAVYESNETVALTCFSLRGTNHQWRRCIDARGTRIWPLLYSYHDRYNRVYAIDNTLVCTNKYRAALYGLVQGARWVAEMHRILVEQRVVYRTPTGRKGDHTRLGFTKIARLVDKVKKNREHYRRLVADRTRVHKIYLSLRNWKGKDMDDLFIEQNTPNPLHRVSSQ